MSIFKTITLFFSSAWAWIKFPFQYQPLEKKDKVALIKTLEKRKAKSYKSTPSKKSKK